MISGVSNSCEMNMELWLPLSEYATLRKIKKSKFHGNLIRKCQVLKGCIYRLAEWFVQLRPKNISVIPLTRPTLFFFFFFSCRPCNFYCLPEKKYEKFSYLPTLKCFRKLVKNTLKNIRIAKLMLRIIFFNSLDVLNFIICMFSGTGDDI